MAKVKGNDLILFVQKDGEYKAIAYSTTCEIDMQADTIDIGSPDTGQWKRRKKRRKSWNVSSGHLVSSKKQTSEIFNFFLNDEPVAMMLGTVAPHAETMSADDYTPDGRLQMSGEALLTRVTITARKGDYVTMSVELTGSGELKAGIFTGLEVEPEELVFGNSLSPQTLTITSSKPWKAYILEE